MTHLWRWICTLILLSRTYLWVGTEMASTCGYPQPRHHRPWLLRGCPSPSLFGLRTYLCRLESSGIFSRNLFAELFLLFTETGNVNNQLISTPHLKEKITTKKNCYNCFATSFLHILWDSTYEPYTIYIQVLKKAILNVHITITPI